MELTKSELEVMNVLWQANRPLSRSEILALSTGKTWKDSSITQRKTASVLERSLLPETESR